MNIIEELRGNIRVAEQAQTMMRSWTVETVADTTDLWEAWRGVAVESTRLIKALQGDVPAAPDLLDGPLPGTVQRHA